MYKGGYICYFLRLVGDVFCFWSFEELGIVYGCSLFFLLLLYLGNFYVWDENKFRMEIYGFRIGGIYFKYIYLKIFIFLFGV